MDKDTFTEHLNRATSEAREAATHCVTNFLPEDCRYIVSLNQSYDGNPLADGETIFPQDTSIHGERTTPLIADDVVELLWRKEGVPEWIDISVKRVTESQTHFELLCCGRFTNRDNLLYYSQSPRPPFGVKSPNLPWDWSEDQGRFDLHTRKIEKPIIRLIKHWIERLRRR